MRATSRRRTLRRNPGRALIPIPVPVTVERLNEQLRALQAFQQRLAVRDAEQGIAQLTRHPVDDAACNEELAHLRRSARAVPMRPGNARLPNASPRTPARSRRARARLQLPGAPVWCRNPAFGAGLDACGFLLRRARRHSLPAQLHDRPVIEVQILRIDDEQPIREAQLAQADLRHAAARDEFSARYRASDTAGSRRCGSATAR